MLLPAMRGDAPGALTKVFLSAGAMAMPAPPSLTKRSHGHEAALNTAWFYLWLKVKWELGSAEVKLLISGYFTSPLKRFMKHFSLSPGEEIRHCKGEQRSSIWED